MKIYYVAVSRNPNTWYEDGVHELLDAGLPTNDLRAAIIDANTLSMLQGEGHPPYLVEVGVADSTPHRINSHNTSVPEWGSEDQKDVEFETTQIEDEEWIEGLVRAGVRRSKAVQMICG